MQRRSTKPLSPKLERKLASYALAAGAAGGALIVASPAEARVVYTPLHMNALAASPVDVDGDGHPDFAVSIAYYCQAACIASLFASVLSPGSDVGIQVGKSGPQSADARKTGGRIGPEKNFAPRHAFMAIGRTTQGSFFSSGSWANVKSRYLGLKFLVGDETHYGWARLNVRVSYDGFIELHPTLTGYAYETIPDKAIVAGDEGTGATSLGHLALGAAAKKR